MFDAEPDEWREVRLGEVAAINPEALSQRSDPDLAFGYIDISQIEQPGRCAGWTPMSFGAAPSRARRKVRENDILVSTVRPYLRAFAKVPPSDQMLVASTGFAVVRAGDEANQDFLFQHILSDGFVDHLKPRMTGSNYPAVSAEDVANYPLLLPSLEEQRRIAEVLRSVDASITAAEAVAYASQNALRRIRDELILLPGYETMPLSEATTGGLFTDGDWVESKDQDPDGEVRLIQLADIGDGAFINKSQRFLTKEKAHELRCTFLHQGDLLVARMPEPLGRCCLFPAISQPCVTAVDICIIRAGRATSNRYLAHALATSKFRGDVLACASGTTRNRVSRGNLGRLEVPMPSMAEQSIIVGALDQIALTADEQSKSVERLRDLKATLISDLLSGRVRVPA